MMTDADQQQQQPGRAGHLVRIEEIRARAEAATPGPWEPCLGSGVMMMTAIHAYAGPDGQSVMIADCSPDEWGEYGARDHRPDLNFIVAAREDIPWLLDRLRAAEERAERAEQALPDPAKLWALADWIDAMYPGDVNPEVQRDLRAWARGIMALRLSQHEGIRVPSVCDIDHPVAAQPATGDAEGVRE